MLNFLLSTIIGSLIGLAIAVILGLIVWACSAYLLGGPLSPHPYVYRYDISRAEALKIAKTIGVPVNSSLNIPTKVQNRVAE